MLTLEQLKAMPPDTFFAQGYAENSPDDIYMTSSNIGKKLLWVAQRGGIYDWAIYIHWADSGIGFVKSNGDKVITAAYIKKLVPCEDAAFKMYRF